MLQAERMTDLMNEGDERIAAVGTGAVIRGAVVIDPDIAAVGRAVRRVGPGLGIRIQFRVFNADVANGARIVGNQDKVQVCNVRPCL